MDEHDPIPGQVVNGKYRVVAAVARGGMGVVYEAEQLALSRRVALKILRRDPEHGRRDPAFLARFSREASLSAKIAHPNVVTVFDYGPIQGAAIEELEGGYFIAMEYIAGETLRDRLRRDGSLAAADAIRVISGVARGVREAHRLGLVHRDLKPGNVMLVPQEDGEWVKVLDFGLVKQVDAEEVQELTTEGTFLGSPRYISPEQVMGGSVDARTDVYSLGVILYQCLCGKVPFAAETTLQTMMARVGAEAPPMSVRTPGYSPQPVLDSLVRRMVARDPDRRPRDMSEVLRDLRGIQVALGLAPDTAAGTGEHSSASFHDAPLAPFVPQMAPPAIDQSQPSNVHSLVGATRSSAFATESLKSPWRRWFIAPAAVTLLLGGAGVAYTLAGHGPPGAQPEAPHAAHAPPVLAVPARVAALPVAPVAPAAPVAVVAARVPSVVPVAVVVTAPGSGASAAVQPLPVEGPARHGHHGHHGQDEAPTLAPVGSQGAHTTAVPGPAAQEGYLSLDTSPWTRVTTDGRDLGVTPLQRVALPAGSHQLTLRNPELGVNTTVTVTIRPGETTARRLGLD